MYPGTIPVGLHNSILTNISLTTTKPYQKIQNQATRIIYKKTKWTSATSSMKQLHWLPIRYRCHFKLLTIVYKTLHGMGPTYLRDRLKVKNNTRNTQLTSCSTLYLEVPFNKRRTVADGGFQLYGCPTLECTTKPYHNSQYPTTVQKIIKNILLQHSTGCQESYCFLFLEKILFFPILRHF